MPGFRPVNENVYYAHRFLSLTFTLSFYDRRLRQEPTSDFAGNQRPLPRCVAKATSQVVPAMILPPACGACYVSQIAARRIRPVGAPERVSP